MKIHIENDDDSLYRVVAGAATGQWYWQLFSGGQPEAPWYGPHNTLEAVCEDILLDARTPVYDDGPGGVGELAPGVEREPEGNL